MQSDFPKIFDVKTIDSTQASNPPPPLLFRIIPAIKRLVSFIGVVLYDRPFATLIFASSSEETSAPQSILRASAGLLHAIDDVRPWRCAVLAALSDTQGSPGPRTATFVRACVDAARNRITLQECIVPWRASDILCGCRVDGVLPSWIAMLSLLGADCWR